MTAAESTLLHLALRYCELWERLDDVGCAEEAEAIRVVQEDVEREMRAPFKAIRGTA